MRVKFIRLIREISQKRGLAIDSSGKLWRGFFAKSKPWEIRLGNTSGAGFCFCCNMFIFEGWESCGEKEGVNRDLCDSCVSLPRIIIVDPKSEDEWKQLLKEFQHASFNQRKWDVQKQ
jgi:hypothetical protein